MSTPNDRPDAAKAVSSEALAQFLEASGGITKPWLLAQLRIQKLNERRDHLSAEAYAAALADIHQDVMNLGEWWVGREAEVFGTNPKFND